MDRKEEIKKELEEISPFLAKLKKENSFEVPANYFEQLPNQIMEQAKLTPVQKTTAQVSWLDRLIASFAFMLRPQVALGILGLVAFTWTAIYVINPPQEEGSLMAESSILEEQTDLYVSDYIEEFDVEVLALLAFEDVSLEGDFLEDAEFDEALIDEILETLEVEYLEDIL